MSKMTTYKLALAVSAALVAASTAQRCGSSGQVCPAGYRCDAGGCLPASGGSGNIAIALSKDPNTQTFWKVISKIGYDTLLSSGKSKYLIFPPNEAAFKAIPQATLNGWLNDPAVLKSIISEHIVPLPAQATPPVSSSLVDGMTFRTLNGQGVTMHIKHPSANPQQNDYFVSNSDGTAYTQIVTPDQVASNGVYHVLNKVLLPAKGGDPGTACKVKAGPCPVARCMTPPPFDPNLKCGMSTLLMWGRGAVCCPEMCTWRANGGTGDRCKSTGVTTTPTRPAPITPPITPQLKPCPDDCKSVLQACVAKGYEKSQCLAYAAKGYLCTVPDASGQRQGVQCNGDNLLPEDPDSQCPDVQTYNTCGGCQPTCENPRPMCTRMCHKGCFCPRDKPLFDDATGTCITDAECPKPNQCEAEIGGDYLDAGNAGAKCSATSEGATCTAQCITGCVPKKNMGGSQKVIDLCAKFPQSVCGKMSDPPNKSEACQWVGSAADTGPTFECSTADDGDAAWAIQEPGTCGGSGGTADEVCDFLEETQCLDKGACSTDDATKCGGLVHATFKSCTIPCFAATTKEKPCADCLINSLFESNTLNLEQPDIFSCCGCLEKTFQRVNIQKAELEAVLYSPCKKHSPTGDDQDDDDH